MATVLYNAAVGLLNGAGKAYSIFVNYVKGLSQYALGDSRHDFTGLAAPIGSSLSYFWTGPQRAKYREGLPPFLQGFDEPPMSEPEILNSVIAQIDGNPNPGNFHPSNYLEFQFQLQAPPQPPVSSMQIYFKPGEKQSKLHKVFIADTTAANVQLTTITGFSYTMIGIKTNNYMPFTQNSISGVSIADNITKTQFFGFFGGTIKDKSAFVVDAVNVKLKEILKNNADGDIKTLYFLDSGEVQNDPATKMNDFRDPYLLECEPYDDIEQINYDFFPSETTTGDLIPEHLFVSKYRVQLTYRKGAGTEMKFVDPDNPTVNSIIITQSQDKNAIKVLSEFLYGFFNKSYDSFKTNVKFQQKRSGDWLQVLYCLSAKRRRVKRKDNGAEVTDISDVFFVTHDQIAAAFALSVGVNVIMTLGDSKTIFVFKINDPVAEIGNLVGGLTSIGAKNYYSVNPFADKASINTATDGIIASIQQQQQQPYMTAALSDPDYQAAVSLLEPATAKTFSNIYSVLVFIDNNNIADKGIETFGTFSFLEILKLANYSMWYKFWLFFNSEFLSKKLITGLEPGTSFSVLDTELKSVFLSILVLSRFINQFEDSAILFTIGISITNEYFIIALFLATTIRDNFASGTLNPETIAILLKPINKILNSIKKKCDETLTKIENVRKRIENLPNFQLNLQQMLDYFAAVNISPAAAANTDLQQAITSIRVILTSLKDAFIASQEVDYLNQASNFIAQAETAAQVVVYYFIGNNPTLVLNIPTEPDPAEAAAVLDLGIRSFSSSTISSQEYGKINGFKPETFSSRARGGTFSMTGEVPLFIASLAKIYTQTIGNYFNQLSILLNSPDFLQVGGSGSQFEKKRCVYQSVCIEVKSQCPIAVGGGGANVGGGKNNIIQYGGSVDDDDVVVMYVTLKSNQDKNVIVSDKYQANFQLYFFSSIYSVMKKSLNLLQIGKTEPLRNNEIYQALETCAFWALKGPLYSEWIECLQNFLETALNLSNSDNADENILRFYTLCEYLFNQAKTFAVIIPVTTEEQIEILNKILFSMKDILDIIKWQFIATLPNEYLETKVNIGIIVEGLTNIEYDQSLYVENSANAMLITFLNVFCDSVVFRPGGVIVKGTDVLIGIEATYGPDDIKVNLNPGFIVVYLIGLALLSEIENSSENSSISDSLDFQTYLNLYKILLYYSNLNFDDRSLENIYIFYVDGESFDEDRIAVFDQFLNESFTQSGVNCGNLKSEFYLANSLLRSYGSCPYNVQSFIVKFLVDNMKSTLLFNKRILLQEPEPFTFIGFDQESPSEIYGIFSSAFSRAFSIDENFIYNSEIYFKQYCQAKGITNVVGDKKVEEFSEQFGSSLIITSRIDPITSENLLQHIVYAILHINNFFKDFIDSICVYSLKEGIKSILNKLLDKFKPGNYQINVVNPLARGVSFRSDTTGYDSSSAPSSPIGSQDSQDSLGSFLSIPSPLYSPGSPFLTPFSTVPIQQGLTVRKFGTVPVLETFYEGDEGDDDDYGGGAGSGSGSGSSFNKNKKKRTIKKRNKIIYKRKTINKKSNAKQKISKKTKKNITIKHHRKKYKKYSRRTKQ